MIERVLKSFYTSKETKIDPVWSKIIEHKSDVLECILLVQGDVSQALAVATQDTVKTHFSLY